MKKGCHKLIEKVCPQCGKAFPGRNESSYRQVYCGNSCGQLHRRQRDRKHIDERISQNSKITENGCIEWIGRKNYKGYAMMGFNNKLISVHRFVYSLIHGPIPQGMCVCHKCDNPPCINIEHLFLGTNADNSKDRNKKKRHAHGERHARAKLTEPDIVKIRELRTNGATTISLGLQFGVSNKTISSIALRQTWKHIA